MKSLDIEHTSTAVLEAAEYGFERVCSWYSLFTHPDGYSLMTFDNVGALALAQAVLKDAKTDAPSAKGFPTFTVLQPDAIRYRDGSLDDVLRCIEALRPLDREVSREIGRCARQVFGTCRQAPDEAAREQLLEQFAQALSTLPDNRPSTIPRLLQACRFVLRWWRENFKFAGPESFVFGTALVTSVWDTDEGVVLLPHVLWVD